MATIHGFPPIRSTAAVASSSLKHAADAALLDNQPGSYYLDWANLANVPTDLADGDDDTIYTDAEALAAVAASGYVTEATVTQVVSTTFETSGAIEERDSGRGDGKFTLQRQEENGETLKQNTMTDRD